MDGGLTEGPVVVVGVLESTRLEFPLRGFVRPRTHKESTEEGPVIVTRVRALAVHLVVFMVFLFSRPYDKTTTSAPVVSQRLRRDDRKGLH